MATRKILGGDYGAGDTVKIDAAAERMPVQKKLLPPPAGEGWDGGGFLLPTGAGSPGTGRYRFHAAAEAEFLDFTGAIANA